MSQMTTDDKKKATVICLIRRSLLSAFICDICGFFRSFPFVEISAIQIDFNNQLGSYPW